MPHKAENDAGDGNGSADVASINNKSSSSNNNNNNNHCDNNNSNSNIVWAARQQKFICAADSKRVDRPRRWLNALPKVARSTRTSTLPKELLDGIRNSNSNNNSIKGSRRRLHSNAIFMPFSIRLPLARHWDTVPIPIAARCYKRLRDGAREVSWGRQGWHIGSR